MTKFVIDWIKAKFPFQTDECITEVNRFFDMEYYKMLKNGSSDADASAHAWTWIGHVFLAMDL